MDPLAETLSESKGEPVWGIKTENSFIFSIIVFSARYMKNDLNIIIYDLEIGSSTQQCDQSQKTWPTVSALPKSNIMSGRHLISLDIMSQVCKMKVSN